MHTLHILGNPNSPAHPLNLTDPFSIAIVKFVKNLTKLGWRCIHYGIQGSQVDCETVLCLDNISHDRNKNIQEYNQRSAFEINKRKNKGDIILCFYGNENSFAANQNNDCIIVEPYIAYDHTAVFAPYRIFVSYATMHMYYGHNKMLMNPSWTDAVITNGFDPKEFDFNHNKEDYVLCFGRIIETKGIKLAIIATEIANKKLIIAGPGSLNSVGYTTIPDHVTVLGVCDVEKRKELMKNAQAIMGLTTYVEPLGNMVIEGYFSGTPAITTDWGGFTDTVIHNVTGYRCRDMRDIVSALNNLDKINPETCRKFAVDNFSEDIVYRKYSDYFLKLIENNFYRI